MGKVALALKMKELSERKNYNKIIRHIKSTAVAGGTKIQVLKINMTELDTELLLKDGFTVEHDQIAGYAAFSITW